MMEYFKPWRRKMGAATLGLACLLTVGWFRSQQRMDEASMPISRHLLAEIISEREYLLVGTERDETTVNGWEELRYGSQPAIDFRKQKGITWFGCFGLGRGREQEDVGRWIDRDATLLILPYWTVILPLTLLSACLSLRKSRAKTTWPTPIDRIVPNGNATEGKNSPWRPHFSVRREPAHRCHTGNHQRSGRPHLYGIVFNGWGILSNTSTPTEADPVCE